MKILIFYQYFGTPKGSWSTRVYENAIRWIKEGHEVTVITAPYEKSDIKANGFISTQYVDGIKLKIINTEDSNRKSVPQRALNAIAFALLSSILGMREKCDVIIASSGPISIGIPALVNGYLRKKPFVFEVRDLWPGGAVEMGKLKNGFLQKLAWKFEKWCYLKADLVVTASEGMTDNILHRFPGLKMLTIPNGADIDLFRKAALLEEPGWLKEKKLFTHIGSLGYIHNCGFIVKAAEFIQNNKGTSDIIIVFIGEGSEREELENYCRDNNIHNVKFIGLLPKLDVVGWVQRSHATLFSTLDNPIQNTCSPNKIFDSFAAGVPVIQTTTGWIKDLVSETACGINTRPGDTVEFASAIVKIAENEELTKNLSINAALVADRFSRDRLAAQYLEKLEEVFRKGSN